ncbi:MAG: nucleoside deaminase [Acidobacteria bacterium]|nr:nucleoside deaminase [Acidobacteriota bacterium]
MDTTIDHEPFIRQCIGLAEEAAAAGDEPFGALLLVDGAVRLTARNRVCTDADVTRHAELVLVSDACRRLDTDTLRRATLYSSTEPCMMCCGAIYWSRIPRVVFGCSSAALAVIAGGSLAVPSRSLFSHGKRPVAVIGPVLEDEACDVHRRFWSHR